MSIMNIEESDIIPICYRCDQKYLHFLNKSIESVLRYYKGKRLLKFYICTNEVLDVSGIEKLKQIYTFDYEIVFIDSEFLKRNNIDDKFNVVVKKKYCGLNFTNVKTNNIFTFNPFSGSKTISCLTIFLGAVTHHKKFIQLDTDTLVIADINELFEVDVSDVCLAACEDWDDGENHTAFNSAVAVFNVEKFQTLFFEKLEAYMNVLEKDTEYTTSRPFTEVFNYIFCEAVGNDWKLLDRSWNVPLTHIDVFPGPKVLHFAESWSGNEQVYQSYHILASKYLGTNDAQISK